MASTAPTQRPDHEAVERILRKDGERLTFYQIARNTGIHVTFICKIFNGTRRPSLRTASKLAAYLGISIEELTDALRI